MIRYITHTHICISMNISVIVTNPYLHIIPLPGLSFYASALIGVLVFQCNDTVTYTALFSFSGTCNTYLDSFKHTTKNVMKKINDMLLKLITPSLKHREAIIIYFIKSFISQVFPEASGVKSCVWYTPGGGTRVHHGRVGSAGLCDLKILHMWRRLKKGVKILQ